MLCNGKTKREKDSWIIFFILGDWYYCPLSPCRGNAAICKTDCKEGAKNRTAKITFEHAPSSAGSFSDRIFLGHGCKFNFFRRCCCLPTAVQKFFGVVESCFLLLWDFSTCSAGSDEGVLPVAQQRHFLTDESTLLPSTTCIGMCYFFLFP